MEYSVNTRPLLQESDSEAEGLGENSLMEENSDGNVVVTSDTKPIIKLREPSDRYHLAYIVFYLLGMTTLLPWNFFITADDYWKFKLRDVNSNHTTHERTKLQTEFTAYLSVASTIPNTLFLILNSFLSHSAILQGSLFGILGKFAPRFITAAVAGQALGGIFAAIAEIFSLSLNAAPTTSGFVYFIVACIMLFLAVLGYCILSETLFFKFHMLDKREVDNVSFDSTSIQEIDEQPSHRVVSFKVILSKIWVYSYSLWMVFFVSLAVYPAVTVLIVSTSKGNRSSWNNTYFVPVIGYLLFSCFDYVGRILSGWLLWPKEKEWLVALLSTARVIFIPLLLLCNAQPRHYLPVLINSDIAYISLMIIFALSNGYLANITLVLVS
ncbi:hypothetical protein J437_LFUL005020, partial [Ladona fulva]